MKYIFRITALCLLLPFATGLNAAETRNIQAAMKTASFKEARQLLFGKQSASKSGNISIEIRYKHTPGIWGGNFVPITIISDKENIESIAVMVVENKKRPRPHGMIPGSPLKPVLAYIKLKKTRPYFHTRITLSTPSTLYVFVKTTKGLHMRSQAIDFYYRTAAGWEAHGHIVKYCNKIKPPVRPAPVKITKKTLRSRLQYFKTASEFAVLLLHPMQSGNWFTKDCRQAWPLRVDHMTVHQGKTPIMQAWLGGTNQRPVIFIRPQQWSGEKVSVTATNTLGQKMQNESAIKPYNLLQKVAQRGPVSFAKHLLKLGADVNGPTAWKSPLNIAINSSQTTIARLLIRHKADVNRFSPLHEAAMKGNTEIVKLLLAHGAKNNFNCDHFFVKRKPGKTCTTTVTDELAYAITRTRSTKMAERLKSIRKLLLEHFTTGTSERKAARP